MPSGLSAMIAAPATSVTLLVNVLVWLYLWNFHYGYAAVGFNYTKVVREGHVWRCVTSSFSHVSALHLVFNMVSLVQLAPLETALGSLEYVKAVFVLLAVSNALVLLFSHLLITYARMERYLSSYALGYSCVVFGLMTVQYQRTGDTFSFFGAALPSTLLPFFYLAATQVLVPQASFVGHLSGILGGFLFAFSAFAWLSDYLLWSAAAWTAVFFVASLKSTTRVPLPCIWIDRPDAADEEELRMVLADDDVPPVAAGDGGDAEMRRLVGAASIV